MIDSSVDFNCFNQQSFSSAVSQNLDSGSGDPAHDCAGTLRPEACSAQQADARLSKGDKMSSSACRRPTSLPPRYLPHALKLCLIAARWPGLLRSQRPRRRFRGKRAQELFLLVRSQSQPSNNEPIDAHVKIGLGHPSSPSKVSLVSRASVQRAAVAPWTARPGRSGKWGAPVAGSALRKHDSLPRS